MQIGILGGTFNPIHRAHLYLARAYQQHLGLDQVLLIPTFQPPHKRTDELADAADRIAMCELAAGEIPGFSVCDFEVRQEGISYTLLTLQYLRGEYPDAEFCLLMGADMFLTIQDWREPREIFRLATLCASAREEGEFQRMQRHQPFLEAMGARCRLLQVPPMPMSSTEIRRLLKEPGADLSGFLPESVLAYIRRRGLYGSGKGE